MLFSWVRRGLKTGVLTTRYPAAAAEMPPAFRGRPLLDAQRCLADEGCEACTHVCLPGALRLIDVESQDGCSENQEAPPHLLLDYARCIMCGLCVTACPADALSMSNDYELAVNNSEDLRTVLLFSSVEQEERERGNGKEEEGHDPTRS